MKLVEFSARVELLRGLAASLLNLDGRSHADFILQHLVECATEKCVSATRGSGFSSDEWENKAWAEAHGELVGALKRELTNDRHAADRVAVAVFGRWW